MDVAFLARLQFAFTIAFHYIYPPLSIGLGIVLVISEWLYLKTRKKLYEKTTRFWIKIFALTFAIGVASGLVMEFEFGTNWASYSRYVGDVFGSALAAEGIFAFFLESGFLAILVFGWKRVGPKMHFFSTVMVSLGSIFSAVWIVVANSWMQTPAGFHIVGSGAQARAEITGFWEMVLNPSSIERLLHVVSGCFLAGAFLVLSISAWYSLKQKHIDFAAVSLKIGLVIALISSLFQLYSGHRGALVVNKYQPAKLAAMEAHYAASAPADLYLFGWVDADNRKVRLGIALPGMLSFLIHGDVKEPVTGLNSIPRTEHPPVNIVFQAYHLMVAIGLLLIVVSVLGVFFWYKGTLMHKRWYLYILVFAVLGPQIANQLGWIVAEVGRQPWIVYGLMKTSEGLSKAVSAGQTLFSLILFFIIYLFLFALFIFLLDHKIRQGPEKMLEKTIGGS
jgi:cytochrome d ubiquinol oxidase subunit I